MIKYLVLSPDCFLWSGREKGIIYDSASRRLFRFGCSGLIAEACNYYKDPDHLYSLEIEDPFTLSGPFGEWAEEIVRRGMGNLVEVPENQTKPISLPPLLNNLKDVDKLRKDDGERSIGENLLTYFSELHIHVGGSLMWGDLYKQFAVPGNFPESMQVSQVREFIEQAGSDYLKKTRFIGNSLLERDDWEALAENLISDGMEVIFTVEYGALMKETDKLTQINDKGIKMEIVCTPEEDLGQAENILTQKGTNYLLMVLIDSEASLQKADALISGLQNPERSELKPFFNGHNLCFFEKYIFLREEDMDDISLSKRNVFAHQAVNTNFFGKLSIIPGGQVYANLNHPPLGNVTDSIYELLYKEMDQGTSWRMLRNEVPCKNCLYRYLCPSISNYELVIGKPDLCQIGYV